MLYFQAADLTNGTELWKSDGTEQGTILVKDIYLGIGNSSPASLANVSGTLYFAATEPTKGTELWKSNGTEAGTILVKDIYAATGNSTPQYLTNVNGTLFFSALEASTGTELWKSDGTAAGTVLVKDINAGAVNSTPLYLTNVNGTLFFQANDPTNGNELWKSDGTAVGTVLVKDINTGTGISSPAYLTNVNGTLFFSATETTTGQELWKSDGTAAGTVLVKDSVAGTGGSNPGSLLNVNGTLFFRATDSINGYELWKSDSTADGTVLVKDIVAGTGSSAPGSLTNVNGTLFFSATETTTGQELWKSDGTVAGTVLVKDIVAGTGNSNLGSLLNVNGTLFFVANDPTNGQELWKSDGTAAGTVLVKDIVAGSGSSSPAYLTNVNGTLFFRATDPTNGAELWKSDGTATGTGLVKDINAGTGSSNPGSLLNINGTLFFQANDPTNGIELWKSDGTAAGTVLVKDLATGAGSSNPSSITQLANNLFFSATDSLYGNELFILDMTNPQAQVTSPVSLTTFNGGSDLLVSGTASDDATGLTGVEVSTDNGDTWDLATDISLEGNWSSWEYDWAAPTTGGIYQILARTSDPATNFSAPTGPTVTLLQIYTLSATVNGHGRIDGDVSPLLSCTGGVCAQGYTEGTIVTLIATPDSGYVFNGWSGACSGLTPCIVTLDAAKDVTANFTPSNVPTAAKPIGIYAPATSTSGYYKISWNISATPGVTYKLYQSGIIDPIYAGTSNFYNVSVNTNGTYNYSVKATKDGYSDSAVTGPVVTSVTLTCGNIAGIYGPTTNTTGSYQISWNIVNTAGVTYDLYENNGIINSLVYSGPNNKVTISGKTNGTYSYTVKAWKAGYIDSATKGPLSTTVNITCGNIIGIYGPTTNTSGSYQISWNISSTAGVTYDLYENNGIINSLVYSGPNNKVIVSGKTNGTYRYTVKATKTGAADSALKGTVTTTVDLTCGNIIGIYAPATTSTGSYKVSWNISNTGGVTYILEESFNGGGWTTVAPGPGTKNYQNFTAKPLGSYSYRVTAIKGTYKDSPVRGPVTVTVN